jgi:hypothetical protein
MGLGIRTMEQRITAGSDFDGTLPTSPLVRKDSIEAYPPDTSGGLFDLGLKEPVYVRSVELKLGGQSSWTVHKRDLQGDEILVICGTNETDFISTQSESFILTAKQALVVRTYGATSALICRVSVQAPV